MVKLFPKKIIRLVTYLQNEFIFQRCINILDYYPAFGIEHFLGGISKGVISGLSNTMLVALFLKIPIFNCDPQTNKKTRPYNYQVMVKEFQMDSWRGFSREGFHFIDENTRKADLIKYLKNSIIDEI